MSVNIKQNGQLVKVGGLYKKTAPIGIAEKYSTEEKQVGVWTDGKPLYQKTFETTSASQVDASTIAVNLTDYGIENIVVQDGFIKTANNITPHGGQSFILWYRESDKTINHQVTNSAYLSSPLYITIQYTKTTDTAGTGIYAPDEATLPMLGDVDINNPVDGQAVVYDSTTGKWKNGNGIEDLSSLISNPLEADVSRLTLKRTGHVYVLQGHMQFSAAVSDNTDILVLPVTISSLQIWQFAHNRTANNWATLFINDKTIRTRYALLADAILSFDMVFLA